MVSSVLGGPPNKLAGRLAGAPMGGAPVFAFFAGGANGLFELDFESLGAPGVLKREELLGAFGLGVSSFGFPKRSPPLFSDAGNIMVGGFATGFVGATPPKRPGAIAGAAIAGAARGAPALAGGPPPNRPVVGGAPEPPVGSLLKRLLCAGCAPAPPKRPAPDEAEVGPIEFPKALPPLDAAGAGLPNREGAPPEAPGFAPNNPPPADADAEACPNNAIYVYFYN